MSWTIGSITLPVAPYKTELRNSGDIQTARLPGGLPIVLAIGKKGRILRLDGHLYRKGWSKDSIDTTYITPLEDDVGTIVAVTAPGSRYDGNWVLNEFTYQENKGDVWSYDYRIELLQGVDMYEIQTGRHANVTGSIEVDEG